MKKIILILIIIIYTQNIYCKSPSEFSFSTFSDNDTYVSNIGFIFRYKLSEDNQVLANFNWFKSLSSYLIRSNINYDINHDKEWSSFVLASYESNEVLATQFFQYGVGLAYVPPFLSKQEEYPFRHKFSVAILSQTDRNQVVLSLRYLIKIVIDNFSLINTVYYKFFMFTSDTTIEYKLNDKAALKYQHLFETINNKADNKSSLGIKVSV